MGIEQVKLSEIVEDMAIYPRGSVSEVRVADLMYALDAGDTLPLPLIDRATRKTVDGVHRIHAYRKRLGGEGMIDVEVQEFPGDLEMIKESARINHLHGLPLGRYDQRVAYLKIKQFGGTDEEAAAALGVTQTRLLQIVVRQADSPQGAIALKRGTEHLGGSYLTAEQVTEIRRMRGAPARSKITELTRLIQRGLVPLEHDADLRRALADLIMVAQGALSAYTGV